MFGNQGFGELKTEQLGGHSQEQQRHRQAPIDDDDVWKYKFETTNSRNVLANDISDERAISDAFAKHFKEVCAPHSEHRNTELKAEYTEMRCSYVSLMDFVEHEPGTGSVLFCCAAIKRADR